MTDLIGSSGIVANATATATLTCPAGARLYLDSVVVTGLGATAGSAKDLTITGLQGGTVTHTVGVPAGATVAIHPIVIDFARPRVASATSTNIVATVAAAGTGNTNLQVVAYGHY